MTYEEALRYPTRRPIFKIEFMDKNENVIDEVVSDLINGSIKMEKKNGIRRTCDLTFRNSTGTYTPDEDGLIWLNNRIKIYTGLNIEGTEYFNPQGIFVLGNPELNGKFSEKNAKIATYDKFALLDGTILGELESDYIVNSGTDISSVVQAIYSDAGFSDSPIIYPTAETTPYTVIGNRGETYADLLYQLADLLSWVVYFDVNGKLRFEPPTDSETQSEVWRFSTDESTYLGGTHKYDWAKIRNYCVVYGDNINGSTVKATASDNNIFSPTYVEKIGRRLLLIEDDLIYTESLAQQRANYELQNAIEVYESADFSCVPVDTLQEDDIVLIEDEDNGFGAERYLINSIDLPLKNGDEMKITAWKVRSIT